MQDQDPIGDISGDGILDILDLIIIIDFILEDIEDKLKLRKHSSMCLDLE